MSTNNHYPFGLLCVQLLLATSLVIAPISATPISPPPAGLEDRSPTPSPQQDPAAKPTTVSGHGVLLGDGTISGGVGEVVTSSGGLQTSDEISSESIIVNGKPLELTGGGLTTVIDGQQGGSSLGGVKTNPDGSTSVDISGSDVTRGGVTIVEWVPAARVLEEVAGGGEPVVQAEEEEQEGEEAAGTGCGAGEVAAAVNAYTHLLLEVQAHSCHYTFTWIVNAICNSSVAYSMCLVVDCQHPGACPRTR